MEDPNFKTHLMRVARIFCKRRIVLLYLNRENICSVSGVSSSANAETWMLASVDNLHIL